MSVHFSQPTFENISRGFNSVFKTGQLSVGLVIPIENYSNGPVPTMKNHLEKVQFIEDLGFKALWIRDVPFNVPSFGDAGQTFDPFTYLGFLAAKTSTITLGVSSIALPLHHPVHVAKAAASIDQLSEGRLILGVASGDRFEEYPAMGINYENRAELFRESFAYIRKTQEHFPTLETQNYGSLSGNIDLLPKPVSQKIPLLITGHSRQSQEWIAEHGDGWMNYPRDIYNQRITIEKYREQVSSYHTHSKPFMQPLYVVLNDNDDSKPTTIPLGYELGVNYLLDHLQRLEDIGVNHVALNLRFNSADMQKTLEKIAQKVLPIIHKEKVSTV